MLEACAIAHSKGMEWLEFITCMYKNYRNVPTNGQGCAQQAGLSWPTLNTCYAGGNGAEGKTLIAVRASGPGPEPSAHASRPPPTHPPVRRPTLRARTR